MAEIKQLLQAFENINTDRQTMIYVDGYPWYIRQIDSTHFKMSNSQDFTNGAIYHIGQVNHRQYYNDLNDWLHSKLDIQGNRYED